ncbi:hypothetical protein P167DRAFT_540664 [Morchella conica CCBAS932]|uniref:Uncharacterized protein n=1 Tax=Morchella conica CCBAS932 TaxID=1392247 RepID=A0A3N4KLH4_9PEZI|nr:hypothetical protein P167DRAFT_540664 [Morchella conica CCBAS932]
MDLLLVCRTRLLVGVFLAYIPRWASIRYLVFAGCLYCGVSVSVCLHMSGVESRSSESYLSYRILM